MILYRYRPIESAIKEINNETFHFATQEELNDPIEGFVRVFWQGDKAAWEGLLRNYICSLSRAINLYLIQADEDILHHRSLIIDLHGFDDAPLGEILKKLGDTFLKDEEIHKLTAFYGTNKLKVREEEMRFVLHFIQCKAVILCIEECMEDNFIPLEEGQNLIKSLRPLIGPEFPADLMKDSNLAASQREAIFKHSEDILEDLIDLRHIKFGFDDESFLYGTRRDENGAVKQDDRKTKARQHRNWLAVLSDFPKVYVDQLKDMIYPKSYIVCFSGEQTNSAMWGNYADHHRGVCFIYETDQNNAIGIQTNGSMQKTIAEKVEYGRETIERNFFTTFGRLTIPQIHNWLTGTDGLSDCYKEFDDKNEWRERYWTAYKSKTYQKIKAWEHEREYRIAIDDFFGGYDDPNSRNIKYDITSLKGVIFGIKTSEYDKKRIMESILQKKDQLTRFKFYQAEYDDEELTINVREKELWKLEKM